MIRQTVSAIVLASLLVLPSAGIAAIKDAPDISLPTLSGTPVRIADLKGRVALLDFWASWCVPCRKSFPEVDALYRDLRAKGFEVIAVNVDEQQRNATAFLEKYPHSMPIAFDPGGKAATAFDLKAMPSTILLDRGGHIRFTHMGYTEKTIAQYRAEILQLLGERP